MLNLMLKDVLVQKKSVVISFIYILFFIFVFQKMGPTMFVSGIVAFSYMLIMTSCAYEDKNKSDILLNSLPLSRNSIVGAKYCSVYVYVAAGAVAYTLVITLIRMFHIPLVTYPVTWEGIIGAITAVSLMDSIYLPIFFKIGYIKSKAINFILFFAFFFGASTLVSIAAANKENPFLRSIGDFLMSQSDFTIAAGLLLITFVLVGLSYRLSLRFYTQREF